jgi:hypothetical protein
MNKNESKNDAALMNAVLADDDWQALSSELHRQGMASLRTQRTRRRLRQSATLCIGLMTVSITALLIRTWWQRIPAPTPGVAEMQKVKPVVRAYSDDELLALFPRGSCVIAEVNGERRIILLKPEPARHSFAVK